MKKIIEEWRNLRAKQIGKRGKKGQYAHFDKLYNFDDRNLEYFLKYPQKNNFYPFIRKDIIQRRYKKNQKNVVERKNRPIMYASHKDSQIYSFYSFKLAEKYKERLKIYDLESEVIAYRSIKKNNGTGMCNIDFAKEIFDYITDKKDCTAMIFDIKGFFDNLDHSILKTAWALALDMKKLPDEEYAVFKSVSNYNYVFLESIKKTFNTKQALPLCIYPNPKDFKAKIKPLIKTNKTKRGIPQGSPISGILANVYLLNFDKELKNKIRSYGIYRRYSDDLIVVCEPSKAIELHRFILDEIKKYKLMIHDTKKLIIEFSNSEIIHTDPPNRQFLQYLGFEFDGKIIILRSATTSKRARKGTQKLKAKFGNKKNEDYVKKIKTGKKKIGKSNYFERAFNLMQSQKIKSQNYKFSNFIGRLKKKLKPQKY